MGTSEEKDWGLAALAAGRTDMVEEEEHRRFVVTYWTGATRTFDCSTIEEAASLAGYNEETEVTDGIHIWRRPEGTMVTNSDGDVCAVISEEI